MTPNRLFPPARRNCSRVGTDAAMRQSELQPAKASQLRGVPSDAQCAIFCRMKFPGNAVFPEMPCSQLFAIETCPQVNVREATRGQAIQRKPPRSGLHDHFCKNRCTRVFTSAMPLSLTLPPGGSVALVVLMVIGHCHKPKWQPRCGT